MLQNYNRAIELPQPADGVANQDAKSESAAHDGRSAGEALELQSSWLFLERHRLDLFEACRF